VMPPTMEQQMVDLLKYDRLLTEVGA
jgi:hypothetical protein